ncbi:MAG: hypothetical protein J5I47_13360 [Vicingus serpentipes]|nr:hypothetical protein [Vicingus serpentipes]
MKIVVLTCIWKRPQITKIFLAQFKQLQDYAPENFKLELVVVGSEKDKSKSLCEGITPHYIEHPNKPLGSKWNAGVRYCKSLDFDYLLATGSDDIISTSALEVYKRYTDEGFEYLGWKDFYLLDTIHQRMKYWAGYQTKRQGESVGAGRFFSKELIKKMDYSLWSEGKNIGLDGSLTKKIKQIAPKSVVIDARSNHVMMVDLKSDVNLGGYHKCQGNEISLNRVIPHFFGKSIYKMIKEL